ncbi:MAG: helix-turn-helix transcriptional regulator [Proteobacteria bacterium]|nr:helix-turn-helix transcriptional regulator [Pseudomonadota bacterium]
MLPTEHLPALRFFYKPKRITQTELGRRIGKSQNFIYRVEAGLRKLEPEEWEEILRALQGKE